ncbi:MAG: acetate--CoA ligase family protein [Chloroflexia bacterium]
MHPLEPLLNPRSVAVIGASEDQGKFGGRAFHLLLRHRFAGAVYPINPNRQELLGLRAYPSIAATPGPVDVAILAIPKPYLQRAVEECVAAGVRGAIVITAQFSEVGEEGAADERRMVETARAGGMRLIGPNCLGLISPVNQAVLTTSPALDIDRLRVGQIGFTSQSGALMATIFDRANDLGIGFSHCVSVGNQADLAAEDFVDYFITDPRTRVMCSYAEGIKDPARLLELAARARDAGKPWLMVKAGRTEAGERAAFSHTASLAGRYAALEAAARDRGIVLMDDPDAMILAASLLARFEARPLRRVAVVTTSGGGGAITADRLSDAGLPLARFAPETADALNPLFMPGQAANPVDLGGRREGEAVNVATLALQVVAADPEVDCSLIVLSTAPMLANITANLAAPAAASGRPYLFAMWPGTAADESRTRLLAAGAPFCDRLDDAVRALRAWATWSDLPAPFDEPRPDDLPTASDLIVQLSAGPLGEAATKELLRAYGIPVNEGRLATSADEAVAAAEALGYPVALKIASPDVAHKSDVGGIVLGTADGDAVRRAWDRLRDNLARRPDARFDGALVQPMVAGDAELIVGVVRDPQFGPLVLVGTGGVLVEVLRDSQLALAPVGPRAAEALLRRLRGWPLLAGVRGRPPLAIDAVAAIVSRVSWLAHEQRDRLAELDINPLIVSTDSAVAVDARAVLVAP